MMRKILVFVFMCIPCFIFGQTPEEFSGIVDFEITMRELSALAETGNPDALPARFVVIDGVVASRVVVNSNPADFVGELHLVGGEWIGVEEVVQYECVLIITGPEFASAIPSGRSRRANPDEIPLNTRVLAVAKALGLYEREDGMIVPVLQAFQIRKIQ